MPSKPACAALTLAASLLLLSQSHAQSTASAPASAPAKPTLAVLPFVSVTGDAKEKELATRMRFAVSQKLSSDANAVEANGAYARLDNVQVDNLVSALQISFARGMPDDDEMQKLLAALDTRWTIAGTVKGRTLGLTLYRGGVVEKQASAEIPPDSQSPKLAVEKVLTDLTGTAFAHIRDVQADHSDPAVEARLAKRPNLVPDPDFELAARDPKKAAVQWEALLGPDHYAPPLVQDPATVAPDRVAIVPAAGLAGGRGGRPATAPAAEGYCLMLRMSKAVAESNGLACESTWIPVEQGKKYRFSALYRSDGPTTHVFLKGFAYNPDQFGVRGNSGSAVNTQDPEAARREYYRAQVLPTKKSAGWELMEMDFTPGSLKATDPKIQWLRIDLYVYLTPGDIYFDHVTLKKIDE